MSNLCLLLPESLVKRLELAYLRSAISRTFSKREFIALFCIIVLDWVFFKTRTLYVHSGDALDRTPLQARLSQRMRRHLNMRTPHISRHPDLECSQLGHPTQADYTP